MTILFSKKSAEASSRLTTSSLLIVSMLIIICVNILNAKYNAVINRTLVFLLIMLTLKCIDNKIIRNVFAVILLIPVAADISLQLYAWNNFNSAFSYGFAMSVLNTTPGEARSMLGLYWRDCLILVVLSALLIYTVNSGPYPIKSKFRRWPIILLCLTLFAFFAQAYLHQIRKSNVESLAQRFVQATPISTAKVFMQAIDDISVVANIGANIPDYKLTLSDTGIDNYVLIIGESERTANMSIYGYGRDTTPELIKQQQNNHLLLFSNAVSPAPVTIMAVPLAITADTVNARDPRKYGDNIINIANKAGYETSWFSRQGKGGAHNNVITGIAMNAHKSEWVDEGYDEELLPLLNDALKKPGKKIIVLHLYGSHEPACRRFPKNKAVLSGGSDADDCYDNSVRYTDTFMGNVFRSLENTRSSVMYFSDHGLVRDPNRAVVYSHGGVNPPREALHIPMFIWYSHPADAKDKIIGTYDTAWSTDDVNTLAELWLGIHRQGESIKTVESWLSGYDKTVSIMDTTGKTYDWRNVR